MSDENELKGKKLLGEIAKYALIAGRGLNRKKIDPIVLQKKVVTIGLLNHAQNLVNVDDSKARRLLNLAKKSI